MKNDAIRIGAHPIPISTMATMIIAGLVAMVKSSPPVAAKPPSIHDVVRRGP